MRTYNPKEPLLSIHIPKCGGSSLIRALRSWYGRKLYLHAYDEKKGKMPPKRRLTKLFSDQYRPNLCVHGHFNHKRDFGYEDYYPELDQAIIFFRDPVEVCISVFHHMHKRANNGKKFRGGKEITIPTDLDEFLETRNSYFRNFLPKDLNEQNLDNYLDDFFIHMGVLENYQTSMDILADKLGKPRREVEHRNISERSQTPSESSIKVFQSKCEFEYFLFNKALEMNRANLGEV